MMQTHRTMSPAREKKILLAIGRKKVKNIDGWAKKFINESKYNKDRK